MATGNDVPAVAPVAAAAQGANVEPGPGKAKLRGRAFYESIGSPKYVVAPMVAQSEFVSLAQKDRSREPGARRGFTNRAACRRGAC